MTPSMAPKKLYRWNWIGGGYNQCYAASKREALKTGNAMSERLRIDKSTFRLVRDIKSFWANYPIFD